MADFLEEKTREISKRMQELRPMVDEYQRLEAAHRALEGVGGRSATATTTRRSAGRGAAGGAGGAGGGGGGRRGRPRGSGTRARQALEIVQEQPGITIPEMA